MLSNFNEWEELHKLLDEIEKSPLRNEIIVSAFDEMKNDPKSIISCLKIGYAEWEK